MPRFDSPGPDRLPLSLDEQTLAFKAMVVLGVIAGGFGLFSCLPLLIGGEPDLLWLGVAFLFGGAAILAYAIDAIETGTIVTDTAGVLDKSKKSGWYRFYVLFTAGGSLLFFLLGGLSIYMALTPAS
jgi:hypothetical protein